MDAMHHLQDRVSETPPSAGHCRISPTPGASTVNACKAAAASCQYELVNAGSH